MELKSGVLIAIEGIDGSGKSTLAHKLHAAFVQHHIATILTKEPGGTELGKHLRSILQEQTNPVTPVAEFLLFAADRAQHMAMHIKPALGAKKLVICDRMCDSAMAYQGYGRGLNRDMIGSVNAWAMDYRKPDVTLYVRVEVATAAARREARAEKVSAFEREQQDFMERVVAGYDTMYWEQPNVILVDGSQSPEDVCKAAWTQLIAHLKHHRLLV